jgi:hypothetical protein
MNIPQPITNLPAFFNPKFKNMTLKTLVPLFDAFFDPETTLGVVNRLQQLARVVRCC